MQAAMGGGEQRLYADDDPGKMPGDPGFI